MKYRKEFTLYIIGFISTNKYLYWSLSNELRFTQLKKFLLFFVLIPTLSLGQSKEEAVELARNGEYNGAISILDSLYKTNLSNEVLADLIVVNSWAGRHQVAVELYKKTSVSELPLYVHKTILNSAKEIGDSKFGLSVVNYGISLENSEFWLLRKAQFLIYQNKYEAAKEILQELENSTLKTELNLLIHMDNQAYYLALIAIDELLSFNPENAYALEKQTEIRAILGLVNTVDLQNLPQTINKNTIQYKRANEYLKWSNAAPTAEIQQKQAKKALTIFDKINSNAQDGAVEGNLRYDRWAALKNTGDCTSVISEADSIGNEQAFPGYAKLILAGCALNTRQPKRAISLYEEVFKDAPNQQPPLDYFYALSDAGESQKALEWIQSLKEKTGIWVRYDGLNSIAPNGDRLDLDLMEISGYQYTNALGTAWELIEQMHFKAPTNSFILEQRASLAAARGLNKMALTDYMRANAFNPKGLGNQEGLLNAYLTLNRKKEAKQQLDAMVTLSPQNQATIRSVEEWKRSQMWESWTNIVFSNSKGPIQNGQGFRSTSEAYSTTFKDKFRWMGKVLYDYTEIPEGEVNYTRVALGVEYRYKNLELLSQIHGNFTVMDELGAALKGVWRPNDYKTINFEVERFSSESPQRGFYSGVRADHASTSFTHRWSEKTSVDVGFQYMWFTDGNERFAESLSINQQLFANSFWNISGAFSAYTSSNTISDVLYFNPERDLSLSPAVNVSHIIKSSYEFSYTHALTASTGYYQQKNFEANWNFNFRYEQNISFNYLHSLAWSISGGRQVYDGNQEPTIVFELLYYVKF